MSTLLLRIAGPMQSWGTDSKFERRDTEREPTRSGIIGMLAAALGIRRGESLSRFDDLKFGVRIDQPGELLRDYQTVYGLTGSRDRKTYVGDRFYLADACFLVGLESDDDSFLVELADAVRSPYFPLCLGRRSCPPTGKLLLGVREGLSLEEALRAEPWQASDLYQKVVLRKGKQTALSLVLDSDSGYYRRRDIPVNFDINHRQYRYRYVSYITNAVPLSSISDKFVETTNVTEHDPFEDVAANASTLTEHDPFAG